MTQDMFLNLPGIQGESQDARHKNEIEVLSWRWEATQPSALHHGSGGGASKATVHNLVIEHYIDRATPNLTKYCLTGKPIEKATLLMRKAGGNQLEYFTMTMTQVIVSRVAPVAGDSMQAAREEVSLSFASL